MSPADLVEAVSAALPELHRTIALAGDPSADTPERVAAANGFAECLGDLWSTLEAAGPAVGELLAVLDMAVGSLPDRAAAGDADSAVLVLELLALLQAHLEDPHDQDVIAAVVELASSESFDPPLGPEAAALWLDLASGSEGTGSDDWMTEATPGPDPEPDSGPDPEPAPEIALAGESEDVAEYPIVGSAEPAVATGLEAEQESELKSQPGAEPEPMRWDTDEADFESVALGDDAAELLAILATAIEESRGDMLAQLATIGRATQDSASAADACAEILGRFADASAAVGIGAFAAVCAGLAERTGAWAPGDAWPESLIDMLTALPERMLDYLGDPLSLTARRGLVGSLRHPQWPDPIPYSDAQALVTGLAGDLLALGAEAHSERTVELEDADLSLSPAEDIDPSVLGSFRREGPELARRLTAVLEGLPNGRTGTDDLRHAQRLAHTLKGSANVCGVRAIAVLSHHMEDLLEFLMERELAPGASLGATLVAGADGLAAMLDMLNGLEPLDTDGLRPLVQQVLDWANRIDREGVAALADAADRCAPEDDDNEDALQETESPQPPAGDDTEEAFLQVPARAIDDLLRLAGELALTLSQSEDTLNQARRILGESETLEQTNLLQTAELERLVEFRAPGQGVRGTVGTPPGPADHLELDRYDALHIVSRRINEGVSDARELSRNLDGAIRALGELADQQIRLSQELRQVAMGTRMVSFGTIRSRLERAVRQTCRATGKEAGLALVGTEVQIDGDVLDQLIPALMHAVRNSIDHGIEPPDLREESGKPRQGRIEIALRHSGNQLELLLSDDGQGLDLERVRAKAVANGLIPADAQPGPQELAQLTLRPGFSTRDRATQVSGRGVGMDVVAGTVRALNGSLAIESESGTGYRLRARIPASLLTVYCLLVQCDDRPIAVPATAVRLAVISDEGELRETAEGWRFLYGGDDYPLVHIDGLLGLRAPDLGQTRRRPVLLVACEAGDRAVLVEALLEGRELAAKRPGPLVPRIPGLLAASVLGDGRVAPIMDLPSILANAAGADLSALAAQEATERARLPTVLVVDDSLSMRRVLTQLVADAGYRPLAARDGMEAIRTLAQEPVDLMLVDMEMPQMNGLELTAHVRAQADASALPIAMITSRSAERHRREALRVGVDRYFVKPYRDDEVLDFIHRTLEQVQ